MIETLQIGAYRGVSHPLLMRLAYTIRSVDMTSLIRRIKNGVTASEYLTEKENHLRDKWSWFKLTNKNTDEQNQEYLILSLVSRKVSRERIIADLMSGNHPMSRNNLSDEAKQFAWSEEKIERAILEHEKDIEHLEGLIAVFKGY